MPRGPIRHVADSMSLTSADRAGRIRYLTERSGLPGSRANLELAQTYAEVADPDEARDFLRGDDEYLALCGAVALGARADDPRSGAWVRLGAQDVRWRVREGVALGLQRLGAADPAALLAVLDAWTGDPHPLVQRARVAAICEPPLLENRMLAAAALVAVEQGTQFLRDVPAERRRDDDVRTLRQALGWCWSVAVVAHPATGLPAFAALSTDADADVQWVVRSNRSRTRMVRLLAAEEPRDGEGVRDGDAAQVAAGPDGAARHDGAVRQDGAAQSSALEA